MRYNLLYVFALFVASPLVEACVGVDCSTEAKASVNVSVVDAAGIAQKDAVVTFAVDGGADEPAECPSPSDASPSCDRWAAGFERSGSFLVKAASADGTKHASATVVVTADECHVVTQSVTLTLM